MKKLLKDRRKNTLLKLSEQIGTFEKLYHLDLSFCGLDYFD